MKILVTGVGGQLGYDVCRRLTQLGIEHKGVDVQDGVLYKCPGATHPAAG